MAKTKPRSPKSKAQSSALEKLLDVMAQLRHPKTGCPWDLEQNFKSIAPHTLEETYEVVDAIEHNDPKAIKEELGDLLFQIVFFAQLGQEQKLFTFDDIAKGVTHKMIERHPHVFGDRNANSAQKVLANWEKDKTKKREQAAKKNNKTLSALDGITKALPASTRAVKLQNRAADVGFDWKKTSDIFDKIKEEIAELEVEIAKKKNHDGIEDETGDLLFAVINLARRLKIDPETALRRTNQKFERRFREIEANLAAEGRTVNGTSLEVLEKIWVAIKTKEKKSA